ncbi:hemicentin-1-like [Acanthochromis polyacanthus]|uniref:hemicentin-1-like n=1 Tax=Acanthochromis polyacanthus TaxID=80966 RepID=UPI00223426D9|nr:hemicentin-1-like [Acanthochromis polyacanthus]
MIILIWATLLLSVRGSSAETAEKQHCDNRGYCVTLTEGELTAEAGLCVVIPCSFTTAYGFTPQSIVWYKCEQSTQQCDDSDMIFHSNKKNQNIRPGFRRRVSLLEPDVSQNNCSIRINDLSDSDSGSYQLRVNGDRFGRPDGYTFSQRATVSVTDLTQKPSVMIPPLTEGKQATLTCTAPGLCSGSLPKIIWKWRGAGENDSYITGNITAFKTENLTAGTKRHSSTLTISPSAEHHGTNITCKVRIKGGPPTEKTLTLNVNYVKDIQITRDTSVKEGESLNLTCSVESFPPSVVMWTKLTEENIQNGTEANLQNGTLPELQNNTETYLQEKSAMSSFTIFNVTVEDSGQYICTAKHLNNTLKETVNVTVIYNRKPGITGVTTVKAGEVLNLTCSIESFPPSLVMWRKLPTQHNTSSNTQLDSGTDADLHSGTGSATLIIPSVTAEDSGQYVCITKHQDTTVTAYTDVTVIWVSMIPESSGCVVESEVLTCVCKSEGFPLPAIQWPLLKKYTDYSVNTTVSNHTVSSTLTVKNLGSAAVVCISSNDNVQAMENLPIQTRSPEPHNQSKEVLGIITRLEIIIAFLSGMLLSAVICCLVQKCNRKNQKGSGNLDETLEMVTSQDDPMISDGPAAQDNHTYAQDGAENGAVAAEKAAPEHNSGPKDVEYASINFSLLRRKSPRGAARNQESTETEYAEIKTEVNKEMEDDDEEEGEILVDKEEEEVMEEDEETKPCVAEEEEEKEEEEEEAVYSNVKDLMDEIMDVGPTAHYDVIRVQDEGGAESSGPSAPDGDMRPKEVEYSNIDFSRMKTRNPTGAEETWGTAETEYAEIKKEAMEDRPDTGGEDGEVLEGNEEEKVVMIGEDEEAKQGMAAEEDVALYSNVKEVMDEYKYRQTSQHLSKKPSVMIPPLTEGQQATLTCTAASLCSGSDPNITWIWRGIEPNSSYSTENITASQGPNSTLTFTPSAKHHSTKITCVVRCTGNETTEEEETATLNVTYVKTPEITGQTTVKEGDALNLTCSVDSFPPSVITWTKDGVNKSLISETGPGLNNDTGTSTLVIQNVTAEDSGKYFCTAKHPNTQTQDIIVTVMYEKKPEITGETTVGEGQVLNLTCTADSFPPALITWTKHGANTTLNSGNGTATLLIYNMTPEHAGQFICTAERMNNSLVEKVDIKMKVLPKILNGSGCEVQSEVLTCVCISQGLPLPTIKWPLLASLTEYSVTTNVSNHTIISKVILSVEGSNSTSADCVSRNENGEIKGNLIVSKAAEEGQNMKFFRIVTRLETIITFLIGVVFSASIFCLAWICCRKKKQRIRGNLSGMLEMVMNQEDPLMNAGQAVEEDQIQDQETLEGAEAAGKSDVDYSNIDFSLLQRKNPAEAGTTETEYAEIKKEAAKEGADGEGKEEEALLGEDEETKHCVPEEKDSEDVAVYSTVQDILDQM